MKNKISNKFLNKKIFKKLIQSIMLKGKKIKAEKIVLEVLKLLKLQHKNPLKILINALKNSKPAIILRIQKKRKRSRTIPTVLTEIKQLNYGISTLVKLSKKKIKKNMHIQLHKEVLLLSKRQGSVIEYKKQLYKTANENKLLLKFNKKVV